MKLSSALVTALAIFSPAIAAANNPPNEPLFEDPINGETNEWLCTALRWGATDPDGDDLRYDVYFGPNSPPPLVATNHNSDVYILPGLEQATTYRWRIVARDQHGAETSSPEWFFTTRPTTFPPTVPGFPRPPDNSTNQLVTDPLRWISNDQDGGCDLTFDVYFGTSPTPPFVATVVDERTYDPGTLNFLTTYYWQIVAYNHLGLQSVGPVWSFTTKANSAPNAPSQPNPLNGAAASTTPQLAWSTSDIDGQTLTYFVYFGENFPPPLVASNLTEATFAPGTLQSGVTYHWQVVAHDGALFSSSLPWSFTARIPGDVVADDTLAVDDAACAMQVYFVNADCGGSGAYITADANCDGNVTPADARCIHREAIGLGCDICQDAVAPAAPVKPSISATVSLSSWLIEGNTLVVRLSAQGVADFDAFGLYTWSIPNVPLLDALPRGASQAFDVWDRRVVSSQYTYVGGYKLESQTIGPDPEFIELRYDISGGMPNSIGIDGFVDALAGASLVYLDLDTMVDAGPIPTTLALRQNFPNPFNPQTTIAYDLPATSSEARVRLRIVDVAGRVVRTLVDEDQPGGTYRAHWEGKNDRGEAVSSGVYFYVLDARGSRQTRKLVLLK